MRKTSKTLFLHAYGVLGFFLEAFDQNESILFPQLGIGSEVGQILTKVLSIDKAQGQCISAHPHEGTWMCTAEGFPSGR